MIIQFIYEESNATCLVVNYEPQEPSDIYFCTLIFFLGCPHYFVLKGIIQQCFHFEKI